MTQAYDIDFVRAQLTKDFTADELLCFCHDYLSDTYRVLDEHADLATSIVNQLNDKRDQAAFLGWVQEQKPDVYRKYQSYFAASTQISNTLETSERTPTVIKDTMTTSSQHNPKPALTRIVVGIISLIASVITIFVFVVPYLESKEVEVTGHVVSEADGTAISGARVLLSEIGFPETGRTDSNGIFHLKVNLEGEAFRDGKINVTADGFRTYNENIRLDADGLTLDIRLRSQESAEVPQWTASPTPHVTSTPTPSSTLGFLPGTKTLTPTITPTPPSVKAPRELIVRFERSLRSKRRFIVVADQGILILGQSSDKAGEWVFLKVVEGPNQNREGWVLWEPIIEDSIPDSVRPVVNVTIADIPEIEVSSTPLPLPAPMLVSPRTTQSITFDQGQVYLAWKWTEPMQPGWFYSVRVGQDAKTGHPDEPEPCFHYQFDRSDPFTEVLQFCAPGKYYWEAIVAAKNEKVMSKSIAGEFDAEDVEHFIEISEASTRQYFDYTGVTPTPRATATPTVTPTYTPTSVPIATATPTSPPSDTPKPDTPKPDTPKPTKTPCRRGQPGCK